MVPRIDTNLMADIITTLINEIGPGHMASTAYDTAWAARLDEIAPSISARALTWLTKNQLPDGTWGAPAPMYYHDRVVCTLAAMIALERRGHREADKEQILKGKLALERIVSGATEEVLMTKACAPVEVERRMELQCSEPSRMSATRLPSK